MLSLNLTSVVVTDSVSDTTHFNTNFVPNANSGETPFGGNAGNALGTPTSQTAAALQAFDIGALRFPAGQGDELFSEHGFIVDGDLPVFVRHFMDFAKAEGLVVNFVVPVESLKALGGVDTPELYGQLTQFAEIVDNDYPGVIGAIELGNEYWRGRGSVDETREYDYGKAAANAAIALADGFAAASMPKLIIQAAGNLAGSFDNDLNAANLQIQAGFSSVASPTDLIDGVLRNFYWFDRDPGGFSNSSGIFAEDRDLADNLRGPEARSWDAWADRDLTQHVGEYNIANRVGGNDLALDLGVHGASLFLEHYANLVAADVDQAFVWPVLHNTRNALIHTHEAISSVTVGEYDLVTNSTRAAMFDLLRQSVVDHRLVELEWATTSEVEVTAFEGSSSTVAAHERGSKVVFFSSRSTRTETLSIDLSPFLSAYSEVFALSLLYDGSDDHRRDAVVTELSPASFDGNATFELQLRPYEVVMVEFTIPDAQLIGDGAASALGGTQVAGDAVAETIVLDQGDDVVTGANGRDLVTTGAGDDVIFGGNDADTVFGGDGDDEINGGLGRDVLHGNDGDDIIRGGFGSDRILSGAGADRAFGGAGEDTIDGGTGADTLEGGGGFDRIYGGAGDDLIEGGYQADNIFGAAGHDTIEGGQGLDRLFGGDGNDVLAGGLGNDGHFGEAGNDTISGGAGHDRLFGHDGRDVLDGGADDDLLWGGDGADRLTGGAGDDTIAGGTGDDRFVFDEGHGHDVISDFGFYRANDILDLSALGAADSLTFQRLRDAGAITQDGDAVVIQTGAASSITLVDTALDDVASQDFAF